MQIKDVMTKEFNYISPDTTIKDAAAMMRDRDLGALPVGENDKLVGMVTDRDIAVRAVAEGKDTGKTRVQDAMTKDVTYCYDDEDIAEAANKMKDKQIRRLIVLNRDKRAIGMVSVGDLAVKGDKEKSGEVLEKVCETA